MSDTYISRPAMTIHGACWEVVAIPSGALPLQVVKTDLTREAADALADKMRAASKEPNRTSTAGDPMAKLPKGAKMAQATKLRRIVSRLVKAEIVNAWKGTHRPDEWEDIENELQAARIEFDSFIREL